MGTGKVADVPRIADAAVHQATEQAEDGAGVDSISVGETGSGDERGLQGNDRADGATEQYAPGLHKETGRTWER